MRAGFVGIALSVRVIPSFDYFFAILRQMLAMPRTISSVETREKFAFKFV